MLKKSSLFSLALMGAMALTPALTSSAAFAVDDDDSTTALSI